MATLSEKVAVELLTARPPRAIQIDSVDTAIERFPWIARRVIRSFFIPRNARRARTGAHNYLYCCEKDDLNGTLD